MDFEQTLADSYRFSGPLGAVAYVVIRGLEEGGVEAEAVESVLEALRAGLKGLDDEQCDTLVHVLERRLDDHRSHGALYELVRLTGRLHTVEATIVHDALEQQGIKTAYHNAHLANPFPDADADVELWVARKDLRAAKGVLESVHSESGETMSCPSCSEENPAHFGICWSCGQALGELAVKAVQAVQAAQDADEG